MTPSSGQTSSFAYQLNNILLIEDLDIFPIKNNWNNNHKSTERQQCVVKQHFIDIDAFAQTMTHDVCTLSSETWVMVYCFSHNTQKCVRLLVCCYITSFVGILFTKLQNNCCVIGLMFLKKVKKT